MIGVLRRWTTSEIWPYLGLRRDCYYFAIFGTRRKLLDAAGQVLCQSDECKQRTNPSCLIIFICLLKDEQQERRKHHPHQWDLCLQTTTSLLMNIFCVIKSWLLCYLIFNFSSDKFFYKGFNATLTLEKTFLKVGQLLWERWGTASTWLKKGCPLDCLEATRISILIPRTKRSPSIVENKDTNDIKEERKKGIALRGPAIGAPMTDSINHQTKLVWLKYGLFCFIIKKKTSNTVKQTKNATAHLKIWKSSGVHPNFCSIIVQTVSTAAYIMEHWQVIFWLILIQMHISRCKQVMHTNVEQNMHLLI